jgi:hypothetical protein
MSAAPVVFDLKPEVISEITRVGDDFAVFVVDHVAPPSTPPLSVNRAKAEERFRAERAGELARQMAEKVKNAASGGKEFAAAAKDEGLTALNSAPFSASSFRNPAFYPEPGMIREALRMNPGDVGVSPVSEGYVVYVVKTKLPVPAEEAGKGLAQFRQSLERERRERAFAEYLANLKKLGEERGLVKRYTQAK